MTVKPRPAVNPGGNGTGTAVARKCKPPKLSGKTLRPAKTLITNANCKLGKVIKPKKAKKLRKGSHLVVTQQSPKPGVTTSTGKRIDVTLKAKQKKK